MASTLNSILLWAVLEMELPGKRKRRRQNRRYLYVVKDDMQEVGMRADEVFERSV